MAETVSKKKIIISQRVINPILFISMVLIFTFSILFSYLFLFYDYKKDETDGNSNQKITVSYDNLIEGNSSGNIAQYIENPLTRDGYGTFCIKSDNVYYRKDEPLKTYLVRASRSDPENGYPILDGYYVEYITAVGEQLYVIARPYGTQDIKKIYTLRNDGSNFACLETDFGKSITSLSTNSNYLYFTVEGEPSIYSSSLDGKNIEKLTSFNSGETGVKIFGIDKSHVYFVNDSYIGKVNFSSGGKAEKLTAECFSLYQAPILTSNGIMFYSSLSNSDYMFVSKAGGPSSKLLNKVQIKELLSTNDELRYINFSSDYLFLVIGENIYYSRLGESELSLLKGITLSENGRAFFDDEYCIAETDDGLRSININWLLSQ